MQKIKDSLPKIILFLILAASFVLNLKGAGDESAIFDETAHIASGYSYVKYLDYRLNPEHPPLLKALSALPLLALDLNFPEESEGWSRDVNGQWKVGSEFLYRSGNDADEIIKTSRIFPIILSLIVIFLIYIWSRELLGGWWALLPAFLFALSPNILAHAHYVTPDIAATFGLVLSLYFFLKFLNSPSRPNFWGAALSFGIAELSKFSLVMLIPYFLILGLFYAWAELMQSLQTGFLTRCRLYLKTWWRIFRSTILIFFVGYMVVFAAYFVFTINYPSAKQVADIKSVLGSFNPQWIVDLNASMAQSRILKAPAEYLYGLLTVLQRAAGGNTAYFLGEVSSEGWWYYFPVVFLLKEPAPSLILILFALGLSIRNVLKAKSYKLKAVSDYLGTHFPEFSMILFVAIYWLSSIRSPLNIGLRYLFPTFPLIYVLMTSGLKSWFQEKSGRKTMHLVKFAGLAALLLWFFSETILAAPNYLSYFNELGGGTRNGYKYVTDSNYDWGQDLKRLVAFVKRNNIQKIAVDYFGGGDPKYYLGDVAEYWWSARGNPNEVGIEWLAVSINTLQGAWAKADANLNRKPEDEYSWLRGTAPVARAGTSIFIYKF